MKIQKAVITAAAPHQRTLPLQRLVDRDGETRSALSIIVAEAQSAGIDDVCIVVHPGDETSYRQALQGMSVRTTFLAQDAPRGYGHALLCARAFVSEQPFLHCISDHLYVSNAAESCASQIVRVAQQESVAVSAVQATRETQLTRYGAVGGSRVPGTSDLFVVEEVLEKPSPTDAEQRLLVPGLRAGHYLCYFGMHVLTPRFMEVLDSDVAASGGRGVSLSHSMQRLARIERVLAFQARGLRYDLGERYGLLVAQLALALSGKDRDAVLSQILELLAQRESARA